MISYERYIRAKKYCLTYEDRVEAVRNSFNNDDLCNYPSCDSCTKRKKILDTEIKQMKEQLESCLNIIMAYRKQEKIRCKRCGDELGREECSDICWECQVVGGC